MNYKTTLTLIALVVLGAGAWVAVEFYSSTPVNNDTDTFLDEQLTKDKLTYVEIQNGEDTVQFSRSKDGRWSLQGNWPVRQNSLEALLDLLEGLHTRFAPINMDEDKLETYGLGDDALTVTIKLEDEEHKLRFGQPAENSNQFARPTYLQIDDATEVLRLAPGLLAKLKRPSEYYLRRRLFPRERVPQSEDSETTVSSLLAKAVQVKTPDSNFKIFREEDDWRLIEPHEDRLDPDTVETMMRTFPDVWAEKFYDPDDKKLGEFGLEKPEKELTITRDDDTTLTLLIGKQSRSGTKKQQMPAPPPRFPNQPPPPPRFIDVPVPYYYARLKDNDQIFDVKGENLDSIFLKTQDIRDSQLARFTTDDVQTVEVTQGKKTLLLAQKHSAKDKEADQEGWHIEAPFQKPAEESAIIDLLNSLVNATVNTGEIIDAGQTKQYGLEEPLVVKLAIEEKDENDEKKVTKREVVFRFGKKDAEKKKIYAQVDGWPRIDPIESDVVKGIEQPAIAFRKKKLFDSTVRDVAKIKVSQKGKAFMLEQTETTWYLTTPVKAELDNGKAATLAGELGELEVVEFVTAKASNEDLAKKYGFEKDGLSATFTLKGNDKKTETLFLGKPREKAEDKNESELTKEPQKKDEKEKEEPSEYYAKLQSEDVVFVVKKSLKEAIAKDSLAYRELELWDYSPEDIAEVRIRRDGPEFALKNTKEGWQISGPFEAKAASKVVEKMTKELATVKAEKYVTHVAKDLAKYGLEKPFLRFSLAKKTKKGESASKNQVLLVGKTVDKDGDRYARLSKREGVFVLSKKKIEAVEGTALNLLKKDLLTFDSDNVRQVVVKGKDSYTLKRNNKDGWKVVDSKSPDFTADTQLVTRFLGLASRLTADRYVAFGEKVAWKKYGLEKPEGTIRFTIAVRAVSNDKKKDDKKQPPKTKVESHTIAIGKLLQNGDRYVRVDQQPGVAVLKPFIQTALVKDHLAYLNRQLFDFDPERVVSVARRSGSAELKLDKGKDGWELVSPKKTAADKRHVDSLVFELAALRAERVAAYPVKDLEKYGLKKPKMVVTVKTGKGKEAKEYKLKVGAVTKTKSQKNDVNEQPRYALADGGKFIAVLGGATVRRLQQRPLHYRNHQLAQFEGADTVLMQRGSRKVVFSKQGETWQMIDPVQDSAEEKSLKEFLKNLASLRADKLIAEKDDKLEKYGLKKPLVRWKVKQGKKQLLDLLVGKATDQNQGGTLRYAKLGNKDVIFQLDSMGSQQVVTEYRNQQLWELDKDKILRLEFIKPAKREESFGVVKSGETWAFLGVGTEAKVDTKGVEKIIDALTNLKPGPYVADTVPEGDKFGLKSPQSVIQIFKVVEEDGRRFLTGIPLLIGNEVKNGKGRYALIPNQEAAPVFILSRQLLQTIMVEQKQLEEPTPKKK
ncbi:MAG: DUF4340 domain-containing protein [Gemmataceae bacterium]